MTSCHACGSPRLAHIAGQREFSPISSDIRIVKGAIRLAACPDCGLLQKCVDEDWGRAVGEVYAGYNINHQSGGADPYIFTSVYGPGPRADVLVRHMQHALKLPARGRLLDIGCASGNILRGFGRAFPDWKLSGIDSGGHWRNEVMAIPGVEFYGTALEELKGADGAPPRFDLIVMSHVLEHIPGPAAYLRDLQRYLAPGGVLFIAVPDIRQNPVDLFVLDHCTHFDAATLGAVLQAGGLPPQSLRADILGKELIACSQLGTEVASLPAPGSDLGETCVGYLALCGELLQLAREKRRAHAAFGVMGSSTAAAWLCSELDMQVDFLVDEDAERIGKLAFGKPIKGIADVPLGACVFIPMSAATARQIIERAGRDDVDFAWLPQNQVGQRN